MDNGKKNVRGHLRQFVVQAAAGLRAVQGHADLGDNVSGIQFFDDVHDRYTRMGIPRFDGGLDAGGSAVAREQRGVGVDAAHGGHVDYFLA